MTIDAWRGVMLPFGRRTSNAYAERRFPSAFVAEMTVTTGNAALNPSLEITITGRRSAICSVYCAWRMRPIEAVELPFVQQRLSYPPLAGRPLHVNVAVLFLPKID